MKKLVAYFSCSGITKSKAEELAKAEGADLIEIVPAKPYTSKDLNWQDKKSRSTIEMNDSHCRPALAEKIDTKGYDEIFIGFPIWWDLAPRIINTFLEQEDLSNVKVIPFATSGGSGITHAQQALKKEYPAIHFEPGKLLNGKISEEQLKIWADKF